MTIVSVPYAEANFEELIDRVLAGEDIAIDCGDDQMVKIEPFENLMIE
jgi:antitoxin (DNA-binding transcriptional repressor) of toxin-antitoxin stability system